MLHCSRTIASWLSASSSLVLTNTSRLPNSLMTWAIATIAIIRWWCVFLCNLHFITSVEEGEGEKANDFFNWTTGHFGLTRQFPTLSRRTGTRTNTQLADEQTWSKHRPIKQSIKVIRFNSPGSSVHSGDHCEQSVRWTHFSAYYANIDLFLFCFLSSHWPLYCSRQLRNEAVMSRLVDTEWQVDIKWKYYYWPAEDILPLSAYIELQLTASNSTVLERQKK